MPDVSKGPAGTRAPFTTDTTAASDRGELSPGDAGLARVPPAAFEPAAVGAGAGRSLAHASVQAQSALDDTVRTADVLVGRDGGATIVPPLSPQGVLDASAASIEPMTTVIDERILLSRVQARLARFAGLLAFALALQNATAWAQFDRFREVFGWQSNLTGNGEIAFSLACCVLSIPSVWLMRRVGVRRWIATSLLLSALIWASPMNVSVAAMIPIPRLLAGIVQAGFFPGLVLYLASWFPRRARVAPIAWLLAGGVIATFIPGPLTRMLIAIEPSDELNVWRILLLIEAIPAFLLGLIALRYLTDAPKDARWLSDPEQKALQTLLDDDEGIDAAARPQAIGRVLTSWRVWALAGVALVLMLGLQSATVAHNGFFGRSWSHAGPSFGALAALWIVAMLSRRGDSRRHGAVFAVIAAVGAFMFFAWGPTTLSMTIALTLALGGIWGALAPFWATASAVASPAAGKVAVPLIYAVSSLSFVLMIAVFQELGARAITILVGICLLSGAAVFVKAAPRISEHSPIAN